VPREVNIDHNVAAIDDEIAAVVNLLRGWGSACQPAPQAGGRRSFCRPASFGTQGGFLAEAERRRRAVDNVEP
jgi:hypothetical protein